jgi:hypothetical protein
MKKRGQSLVLEEIKNPRCVATDYLLKRLGLNFRAGSPSFDKDRSWHIPLLALIPSSPDVVPRRSDQLFYRFESFGEVVLDSELKVVSAPSSGELNVSFQMELARLFSKIEQMIVEFGNDKWGRIPLLRSWLNPLNAIVSQALSLPSISVVQLENQGYTFYSELLRRAGFIEGADKPGFLRKSNDLVMIADRYQKEKGLFYMDDTVSEVTSIICSKFYDDVKDRVRLLQSYVETTVAYYARAVRFQKLLPMSIAELEYAYNVLGRREQDERSTFYGKVADLVTAGFLQWVSEGVVIGLDQIYARIASYESELEGNMHVLKANV